MTSYAGNQKNPKGLLSHYGVIYSFLGFFNHLDTREMYCDDRGNLPFRVMPFLYKEKGIAGINIPRFIHNEIDSEHKKIIIDEQLKNLNLNPLDCFVYHGRFTPFFVFKKHTDPIPITQKLERDPAKAVMDFFISNHKIPLIMSENAILKEIASAKRSDKKNHSINSFSKEELSFILGLKIEKSSKKYIKSIDENIEEFEKIKKKELSETPDFELCSDYKKYSEKLKIDLFDLQKRIVAQANRKGGFVNFVFKNKTYKIPKLPLILWANRGSENRYPYPTKHDYNGDIWFCVCPEDLKTNQDDPLHSDWWIGAGLPIEVYSILGHGNLNYFEFNRHLGEFACDISDNNRLNNVKFLAGGNLSSINGKINIYPPSLNAVSEGDVLVLSHAGVEFDLYLKKACKNGKGAVIVEVGNGAAHLSIVSRELGFRLILLPNASKMLKNNSVVEVNPSRREITPLQSCS